MATLTKTLLPISGYTDQYYTYQCTVIENSYDINKNTSNVTINFSIKGPWAPSFYEWTTYFGIVVDGSVKKSSSSSPYISTSYVQLLSWTGNIVHDTDGSKSINVGVYLYNNSPSNYLPTQYSSSSTLSMGSVTLTTIPRASSITSAGNITLGKACNIKWTPASTGFKYKVKFSLGGWSHTTDFISPNTTSSYAYTGYTIPNNASLLDDIPSSVTGTMTATLTTYNASGTKIGSSNSKTFTVTVPSSVVPTVGTITLDPVNITTLDGTSQNIIVQGKNKLKIRVSECSAGTGSSIKSYTFSGPNLSITTTNTSATSDVINSSGTLTYTVKVTDTRGRTATKTATITCHAYTAPYIKFSSVYRCNSSGTKDDNGAYANCAYTLGYSSVNNTNNVTVKIMYKKNTASSYSSVTALSNGTATSGNQILSSIDTASTYTVYAIITDQYGGSSKCSVETIFSIARVFNVRPDGNGIALGKMAESSDILDVKWPIRTDDPATTMSNLSFRGTNVAGVEDSTAGWCQQGNLTTVYYSKKAGNITNQPATAGFLVNITNHENQVHQLWATQSKGDLYHRGGNNTTSVLAENPWRKVLDTTNTLDYVVSQGTSGKTTYRKWNSGVSEMWYYEDLGTMAMTTSMAGGVYSNTNCNSRGASYPSGLFLTGTIPTATINVYSNGYTLCQVSEVQVDNNQFVYRVWSPYSTTLDSCKVSIYATGKWK